MQRFNGKSSSRTAQFGRAMSMVSGLALMSATAWAQQTPATTPEAEPLRQEEIIVTGSNIRGASDSGAIAVSILDAEQLATLGATSAGEIFEALPQAGAFEINSASDGPNDARGDVATINLRGLGTGNSLVLLNGRRLAAHAVNQDIGSTPRQITNVNAFPASGIDRVEVLRDGASALYGADATAGVVNTILSANEDDTRLSVRNTQLQSTEHRDFTIEGSTGFEFNDGKSRLLLVGSYFDRNGLFADELDEQFNTVDKRGLLGDNPFGTDTTDFRNTSTSSPFGQFQLGRISGGRFIGQRARIGTNQLTSSTGVFHIQPCNFTGTRIELGNRGSGCVGIDDANLDIGLRYDFNRNQPNNALNEGVIIANDPVTARGRQLISETRRLNSYALFEHDFANGVEGFAEVLYYKAETDSNRAAQPLDSGLAFLIIPRTNFWNPFGAVGSPNRLPGLNTSDVPTEGRDVLLQNWRPTDLGPRFISTETDTYRVMAGLRGDFGAWEWESALAHSSNSTTDTESNRLSKTLLQAELAKSTPDAINPFGGPNANTQAQWDRVRISSTNEGMTRLSTLDFRASNSELFTNWAGAIGAAFGAEWRAEYYEEDRDPRLDGTIIFDTTNVSGVSDVVGVSPTRDSSADRNVYSVFGEALVPLHRGTGTFKNDLTLQVAVRGEYFDDLEDSALKPKIALSWFPISEVNFRAAYSEGFRVPNLVQLNRGDVSRLNLGVEDYWRSPVTNDPVATGAAYVASVRRSNPDLENEDTQTVVAGMVADLTPIFNVDWLKDLRFSVDYWSFEQTGVIGAFGDQEALALDLLLRRAGSSNPNVVRAEVTDEDRAFFTAWNAANPNDQRQAAGQVLFINDPYINLDEQNADGFDFGLSGEIETKAFGNFDINLEATYLNKLDVVRNELLNALANDPSFGGDFTELQVDRIRVDGNPQWRATASLRWNKGPMSVGGSVRYISDFEDTGADLDQNADGVPEYWQVEEAYRVSLYGEYRFKNISDVKDVRLRIGANNIFDEAPPLVDESLGYRPDFHSLKGREVYLTLSTRF
jgi:outer membrane receptor protein involved in Fe transport